MMAKPTPMIKIKGKRCPNCKGLKVLIDRFDHSKSNFCPVCKGKGKVNE